MQLEGLPFHVVVFVFCFLKNENNFVLGELNYKLPWIWQKVFTKFYQLDLSYPSIQTPFHCTYTEKIDA